MADFDDDAVDMSAPKVNRRPRSNDDDDENDVDASSAQPSAQQSRPPMKGWGDSGNSAPVTQNLSKAVVVESSGVSENFDADPTPVNHEADNASSKPGFGRRSSTATTSSSKANTGPKDKYDSDVITDITEIPDVEDENREQDFTTVVAEAPNVRSNRVQALQELENQIQGQLPSAIGDGIDLSILSICLTPQENISEPDELWQFDQLFADVSSEMQAEMELTVEKEEGEEGEPSLDDENAGVARGDGKKAQPIRDRSNQQSDEQKQ